METPLTPTSHFRAACLTALLLPAAFAASLPAQDAPAEAAAVAAESSYTIGPADVLQMIVWKEPDLTRQLTVRFDGVVSVPLVGDLPAAGQTPVQLAETLTKQLRRFIELPLVTISVTEARSARFFVVGQVQKSGEFPLAAPTTVLQALALAGGFKDFAKTDAIVIVRKDRQVVPVNYKRIADGSNVSQNVLLLSGDTVLVP